jgi:hypothetical protein
MIGDCSLKTAYDCSWPLVASFAAVLKVDFLLQNSGILQRAICRFHVNTWLVAGLGDAKWR